MMRELSGKTAVVTGGASGIGLALARAFAGAGMKVMLADVEAGALERAVAEIGAQGAEARGVLCDVADRAAVERAAAETIAAFGKVHVLCNNAGIGAGGRPVEQVPPADWDWTIGVNLMGVIHGIAAFLPRIKAQGEGGHVVNTASMAGLLSGPLMSPYNATKFAVVTLSETLFGELTGTGIGVSVLCPGYVDTRIDESARNRPARLGPPPQPTAVARERMSELKARLRSGMKPDDVAARVMAAIRDGDLYIFTHPEMRELLEKRFAYILAAYDRWNAFPGRGQ
jgi:NAD(P)-dependent dehydrogenase (short-subunit alcohol dehydrogenase family)